MVQVYHEFADENVVFLGLTPEGSATLNETEAFVKNLQIPWPVGYGAQEMMEELAVVGYPTKFVVGRDGIIRWAQHSTTGLEDAIREALQ